MRVRAASIALVVSLLAGCHASGGNPQPSPIEETPSASTSSNSPEVSPAPEPPAPPPAYSVPLALVVHAPRSTAVVALAVARQVGAWGAPRWSDLGQAGGTGRVLSTKERRAS